MKVGDKFTHPDFGRGTVVAFELRGSGRFVVVDFGYAKKELPIEELPKDDSDSDAIAPDIFPPVGAGRVSTKKLSAEARVARAGIFALKLGQILETHVTDLTVATGETESQLESVFSAAKGRSVQFVLVEGAWGAGKTHLLTLMTAMASRNQFATSTTILDGASATFSQPNDLLSSITSNIRFPNEPVPFGIGHRLPEVMRGGMATLTGMGADRVFRALRAVWSDAMLNNPDVVQILEDYLDLSLPASHARASLRKLGCGDVDLPAMRALRVDDRAPRLAELLGDWTAFCVACRTAGLLVVFDEVDVDYARASRWNLSTRQRHDAMLTALSGLKRRRLPLVIAFGSAPAGPDFADEDDAARDVLKKLKNIDLHIEARQLERRDLDELAFKIWRLYASGYPGFDSKLTESHLREVQKRLAKEYFKQIAPVPRRYVRALLHCFDVADTGRAGIDIPAAQLAL